MLAGNWSRKLGKLVDKVGEIAAKRVQAAMLKSAAAEAMTLVRLGFAGSHDPYGKPWKSIERTGMILRKTGILANSFSTEVTETGFRIFAGVRYAAFHQFGTFRNGKRAIHPRPMLPLSGGLGTWKKPIVEVMQEVLERWQRSP